MRVAVGQYAVYAQALIRLVAAGVLVSCWLPWGAVHAQACPPPIEAWASGCIAGGTPAYARACPSGHVLFDVGEVHLGVDVGLDPESAFVAVDALGVSPLGSYPDWSAAPEDVRAAFDALVQCVRADPAPLHAGLTPRAEVALSSPPLRTASGLPWSALIGVALVLVLMVRVGLRRVGPHLAVPFGLGLGTFVLRRLVVSEGYFHQNGQGALWVAHALGEPSDYGPGYGQLFGTLASWSSDADRAVFLEQGVLSALGVAAVFVLGQRIAGPLVGWALGLVMASSPILARLAQSESYFGAQASLLAIATAVLVVASSAPVQRALGPRALWIGLGPLAAGAFLAQVALIHPVAWVAAALVPTALLVLDGSLRARAGRALGSALVCGGVVLGLAGPTMLEVLEGSLGQMWLAPASETAGALTAVMLIGALSVVGAALLLRKSRHAIPLALLALVALVIWRSDLLSASLPGVHQAYVWLFVGPLAAIVAALAPGPDVELASRRGVAVEVVFASLVLAVGLAWHGATASDAMLRATDAREGDLFRAWRGDLPDGAVVAYLARLDLQTLTLPVGRPGERVSSVALRGDAEPPDLSRLGPDVYLYRSGLCTTSEGRAYCDRLEARYLLTPLHTARLAARPSLVRLAYDRDEVDVGLYRVERAR